VEVLRELGLLLQLGPRAVVTRCAVEVLPEVLAVVAELGLLLQLGPRSAAPAREDRHLLRGGAFQELDAHVNAWSGLRD
jgi:hypothetical protein